MNLFHLTKVISITMMILSASANARDTDIFLQNPGITSSPPNILVVMDNSANWNANIGSYKKYEFLSWGLYKAFTDESFVVDEHDDPVLKMHLGFMGFSNDNTPKGGKVHQRIRALDEDYQAELKDYFFNDLDDNDIVNENCDDITDCLDNEYIESTNNAPYAMALNEAWLYFAGQTPHSGIEDYEPNDRRGDDFFDPECTSGAGASGDYKSPIGSNICGQNYIIVIGNGTPDNGEDSPAEAALTSLGGRKPSDPIDLGADDQQQSNWADEYARFMAANDADGNGDNGVQNVTTYVIDVFDVFNKCTAVTVDGKTSYENCTGNPTFRSARSWMKSIASNGKGGYYSVGSADQLIDAITDILEKIQAKESVFASTTLPVSVNVRGTNLNQVYMGVFQPNDENRPRWYGNLKLYQLGANQDQGLFLADSNGNAAEDRDYGFIIEDAVSFWTTASTYWSFRADTTESDSPDGREVEKGAAAQKLRATYVSDTAVGTERKVYTCTTGCGVNSSLSATPFKDTNTYVTAAGLSADLINWVRGDDNKDNEDNNGTTNDVRASIHGDVLHSEPAVINYNADCTITVTDGVSVRTCTDNDVVVYYGSNDGLFHAIQGGITSTNGYELWSFAAPEHFSKLNTLRQNTEGSDSSTANKPLFFDGSIGIYQKDINDDGTLDPSAGDKVYIYLSMRRGGDFIYALDVSDRNNPKLLWKKLSSDDGFGELGETWSEPQVLNVNLDLDNDGNATTTPVVVFGAGYDPAADDVRASSYPVTDFLGIVTTTRVEAYTKGRGMYVVNAITGDLIWRAGHSDNISDGNGIKLTVSGMDYSIPSEIAALNLDYDSEHHIERLYVGDTGGNVWRANISDPDPANWTVSKLASLSGTEANARKFLFAPDIVDAPGFKAILIGSGDREDPFDGLITSGTPLVNTDDGAPIAINRYYMLKDDNAGVTITEGDMFDTTNNSIQNGTDAQKTSSQSALNSAKGWYITMEQGEKVVSGSITIGGTVFFGTNTPNPIEYDDDGNPLQCSSDLGIARHYMVNYMDATVSGESDTQVVNGVKQRYSNVAGGGFPPTPVPITVDIGGKIYEGAISGPTVLNIPDRPLNARERTFWFKEFE